ncbi:MAG: histidinol-phosphate transaminase [Alphaproteobacteria bacterium]|nr:histidinol-phosphate transaminase [Alphaproteobacteria bacterium]
MTTTPVPRPGIMSIAPYVPGEAKAEGQARVIKLASNESALGASPRAKEAFRRCAEELHRYPDGAAGELRQALAEFHGLAADRIVVGNGSDEVISILTHAYAGPGDEVLYSQHGFLMYPIGAKAVGATPVAAPERDYTASVDALLAAVSQRTRIVFVANPNNPTGTFLRPEELRRLRDGLPANVLLVIDAAYAEYCVRNDYSAGRELVDAGENTVMTRTFSKIYGLAALRLGWAYCPKPVADVFHRVRGPFNVNAAAQAAGIAALRDVAFTDRARAHNDIWLPWLSRELTKLGLAVIPSVGNFLTACFRDQAAAGAAQAALKSKGILPRAIAAYGLADCLRFTVGTEDENRAVVAALAEHLGRP